MTDMTKSQGCLVVLLVLPLILWEQFKEWRKK